MAGNTYGKNFKITTWGESHGKAIGVVVDGCPAGVKISEDYIQEYLDLRKPGQSDFSTSRKESDKVEILSGVFEEKTTGTPISLIVKNQDQNSRDYSDISDIYRPGHADYTYEKKYGVRDYRGGGRASGRETVGRVIGGAIASLILREVGIEVSAYTKSIGDIEINYDNFDESLLTNDLRMPDAEASANAEKALKDAMENKDSLGGVIECVVTGAPTGLGEPCFDKLDANLSKAVMSIGAIKGFEIGDGFEVAKMTGTTNNDSFTNTDGEISKATNHSGGILGGISDGDDIVMRCAIKPTPSIASEQKTVDKDGNETTINVTGRHDPIIVPRAVVVVESMVAITLVDALFENMHANLENIKKIYK